MNEGRVFSWTDTPATGHPGSAYNCRCVAIPYVPGRTEFGFFEFTTSLASSYDRWTTADFVHHYYRGKGRPITLLEAGHLRGIAHQYAFRDGMEGAFRRLADEIASKARKTGHGDLRFSFGNSYDFGDVAFSHGFGVVRGKFAGSVEDRGDVLRITGDSSFEYSDKFADPLDVGIEAGGVPYRIVGSWSAQFTAEVHKNRERSHFIPRFKKR
jgi:hypothetical protein